MSYAQVIEITNIFEPRKGMLVHTIEPGQTLSQWLRGRFGDEFKDFSTPTICNINGKWILREFWEKLKIKAGDLVQFIAHPGYGAEIAIYAAIAAAIVVAVVAIALAPVIPETDTRGGKSAPVYTIQGQNNRFRPGEPLEVCYGRNRIYPSYAAAPYTRYINHEQYQYAILSFGKGYFEIGDLQVEDSPLANFPEVQSEILEPGDALTLFNDNVITSAEIGGIELFAPNQEDFPASGSVGPFVVNPPGTATTKIEIDLVCPNGLFANVDGLFSFTDCIFDFEARLIDDDGAPLDDWFFLVEDGEIEDRVTRPRAYTFEYAVAAGRYEVRGTRKNDAPSSGQIVNRTLWQAARAYLAPVGQYDEVTTVALIIKATNNLNDNSRNRINAICTRKLPVWDGEEWLDDPADLVATRSPVMAFCDAFRANYGGNLAASYLDMEELTAMEELLEGLGVNFDWIFDQKTTLLDVAKTICRVGRCVLMMAGSRLFMVRDQASEDVVCMFSPDNILKGTFSQEVKLFEFDGYDSVIVEYVDPVTFETKEVTCTLPGGTTDNPERVKIAGCTSELWAYREGMYLASVRRYMRKRINFRTGMEGVIAVYGDLVSVSHDVPRWGTTGVVESYAIGGASTLLTLSEPVDFEGARVVMLRDRYGAPSGPHACTEGPEPNQVIAAVVLDPDEFPISGSREPVMFSFGPVETVRQICRVARVEPADGEEVAIECLPYNPVIYDYDEAALP